jgi:3-hydroxyacyl-CoA dehydrogenase
VDFDKAIDLEAIRRSGGVVEENAVASILAIGDGVYCVEFRSKMNAMDRDVLAMLERGVRLAETHGVGLVVANEGRVFSAGANLALIASDIEARAFDRIEQLLLAFQRSFTAVKYAAVPVVAAPRVKALGGGCELCLHAHALVAHADTSMGLVELSVGLLPAGGGTKEMALKAIRLADEYRADVTPFLVRGFDLIVTARASRSADELRDMGFLRHGDSVVPDAKTLVGNAKLRVLALSDGHRAGSPALDLKAPGRNATAVLAARLHDLRLGGYITEYDEVVGTRAAEVLAGGDVPAGTLVTEEHYLALEREAFLSLCGEPRTLQRIRHVLATGERLRN